MDRQKQERSITMICTIFMGTFYYIFIICLTFAMVTDIIFLCYRKGLVYLEVPIDASDHISVPPLEGFVMNRVLGDYFETLLYKIFVSVDEKTSVGEVRTNRCLFRVYILLTTKLLISACQCSTNRSGSSEKCRKCLLPPWFRS